MNASNWECHIRKSMPRIRKVFFFLVITNWPSETSHLQLSLLQDKAKFIMIQKNVSTIAHLYIQQHGLVLDEWKLTYSLLLKFIYSTPFTITSTLSFYWIQCLFLNTAHSDPLPPMLRNFCPCISSINAILIPFAILTLTVTDISFRFQYLITFHYYGYHMLLKNLKFTKPCCNPVNLLLLSCPTTTYWSFSQFLLQHNFPKQIFAARDAWNVNTLRQSSTALLDAFFHLLSFPCASLQSMITYLLGIFNPLFSSCPHLPRSFTTARTVTFPIIALCSIPIQTIRDTMLSYKSFLSYK